MKRKLSTIGSSPRQNESLESSNKKSAPSSSVAIPATYGSTSGGSSASASTSRSESLPSTILPVSATVLSNGRSTLLTVPTQRRGGNRNINASSKNLFFAPSPTIPSQNVLSIPGYVFEEPAYPWVEPGSSIMLCEGKSLKDSTSVLAKIVRMEDSCIMTLEREIHVLSGAMDSTGKSLRIVDIYTIPPSQGNVLVLLLRHPGRNVLSTFYAPDQSASFLLPDGQMEEDDVIMSEEERRGMAPWTARRGSIDAHPPTNQHADGDIAMAGSADESDQLPFVEIDIASFLEFAVQASHCVEALHSLSLIHSEIRPNAFHWNIQQGSVKFAHFGNRSASQNGDVGGLSGVAMVSESSEDGERRRMRESLCYLAPEQTGRVNLLVDHRADLYSLGVTFYSILTGSVPFFGNAMDVFNSIVSKQPSKVQEVRPDVPRVISEIIDKLLSKTPDDRYLSAAGLRLDLLKCQTRLSESWANAQDENHELVPWFPVAKNDKHSEFTIPSALFGRQKELDIIKSVIRRVSATHPLYYGGAKRSLHPSSGSGSQSTSMMTSTHIGTSTDNRSDTPSSHLSSGVQSTGRLSVDMSSGTGLSSAVGKIKEEGSSHSSAGSSGRITAESHPADGKERRAQAHSSAKERLPSSRAIIITGRGGIGKSALVLESQSVARASGFWGIAKFNANESSPYSAILASISLIIRQIVTEFPSDLPTFVTELQKKLGPQIANVQLLFHTIPSLKELFELFNLLPLPEIEQLSSAETRARFQSLIIDVISTLAKIRMLTMFCDDLHYADQSSLGLIRSIASAKIRMLIITTFRPEKEGMLEKAKEIFGTGSRATWIELGPISQDALAEIVAGTLHQTVEASLPLVHVLFRQTGGNVFSARNLLLALKRHHHIFFDWEANVWRFNLSTIENNFLVHQAMSDDVDGDSTLVAHLQDLNLDTQRFLMWASFFGGNFSVRDVFLLMDQENSEESSEDDARHIKKRNTTLSRGTMNGYQYASFQHDRYRQAAFSLKTDDSEKMGMYLKIVDLLLLESEPEIYTLAEHIQKCVSLLQSQGQDNYRYREILRQAGDLSSDQGAHEMSLQYLLGCQKLLRDDTWTVNYEETFSLQLKIAELKSWSGAVDESDVLLYDLLDRSTTPSHKASSYRVLSRNHYASGKHSDALSSILLGLAGLGVELDADASKLDADIMFEEVKNSVLSMGIDHIHGLPAVTDPTVNLASQLLSDATTIAYWANGEGLTDIVGLTLVKQALKYGVSPSSSLGFMFFASSAAEEHDSFRFALDIAKLSVRLAHNHSTNMEKGRVETLYGVFISPFDSVHLRINNSRYETALKFSLAAGDRTYSCFAQLHRSAALLFSATHLSDSLLFSEEALSDVSEWRQSDATLVTMGQGIKNCLNAMAGKTTGTTNEDALNSPDYNEAEFIRQTMGSFPEGRELIMNYVYSFRVPALYSLGFFEQAAENGFYIWETKHRHPSHFHVRYGLYYHSLALVECLRSGTLPKDVQAKYRSQIDLNQAFIRRWLDTSPTNCIHWLTLVDAEVASLEGDQSAFKLYDLAVRYSQEGSFVCDEGWSLFLSGTHFVRCRVTGLGLELQQRAIKRQLHWGAFGIVNYLTSRVSAPEANLSKSYLCDAGVQTDRSTMSSSMEPSNSTLIKEYDVASLSVDDLAAIIKSSQLLSSDVNIAVTLETLTGIVTENSGADSTVIIIRNEEGEFAVATRQQAHQPTVVLEKPLEMSEYSDRLCAQVASHVLNSQDTIFLSNARNDPRFAQMAMGEVAKSVICLPISFKGLCLGAIYATAAKTNAFTANNVTVLSVLGQQASISINNAHLFRKLHKATQANIKMIDQQKQALDEARRSRLEAVAATKIKSNFLASMSHELRTPFSSFYGLLGLLSETSLNSEQREFVQTAKHSCELLLEIIDSLLDYSKLEAGAVKLEILPFPIEDSLADCVEILTMANSKGIELSWDISNDVPLCIASDSARIRQILMNVMGNALKFTSKGYVRLKCLLDESGCVELKPNEVALRFEVRDSGIGMTKKEQLLLFQPFSQVDGSTTRLYGGTGLGLSICLQLVKLLRGKISVDSEYGAGSCFWFVIPVGVAESSQIQQSLNTLRQQFVQPKPPTILVFSPAVTTMSLITSTLDGASLSFAETFQACAAALGSATVPFDFMIVDTQAEEEVEELKLLASAHSTAQAVKIIHLFSPTAETLKTRPPVTIDQVRLNKPIRRQKLLQLLVDMKINPERVLAQPAAPAEKPTKTVDRFTDKEKHILANTNVLIAEDNPVAQKLLIKQLERLGLKTFPTSDGDEAVAEWDAHPEGFFQVALFDQMMPACNGPTAASRIRALEQKKGHQLHVPIIALSADSQQSAKLLCISAGMQDYLTKPMRTNDLEGLLRTFVLSNSPRSS